jgi:hypothetical protein
MSQAIEAYPESRAALGETVRKMSVDHEALNRPLERCRLEACGGSCCHDGVYLSSEEARVIRETVEDHRHDLERIGVDLSEQAVVYGKWRDVTSGPKTATRSDPSREGMTDYPGHFPATSCVFLLPDFRCALQVFAVDRGLHPWHLKPLTCWLHPLSITSGPDRKPRLTLHDENSDPQRFDDYDGFVCRTHCGRTASDGEPAWRVLREELAILGEIGDRDLIAEIEEEDGLAVD